MLRLNNLTGFGAKAVVATPSPQYLGYVGDNYFDTGGSPKTLSGADLGTAHADRVIVVCVPSSNGQQPSSITVGGVSTTAIGVADGTLDARLYYAAVPTGATGDIVFTYPSGEQFSATWYAIYPASSTPVTNANQDDVTSGNANTTITTQDGDTVIACVSSRTDSTLTGASWTGTATPTIDKEGMVFASTTRYGHSLSIFNCDAETSGVLTASGTSDNWSMTTGVWR